MWQAYPQYLMGEVITGQHDFHLVSCCLAVVPTQVDP